ncbi:MAG: carboxypeptidase regulatory-like domain-containing protein [Planctomycetes bacterium]|nr:carboxypeptidase regulatory-like domain-containing protein [Planctomycetota bacterium]
MAAPASLRGRVVEKGSGLPVPGARVLANSGKERDPLQHGLIGVASFAFFTEEEDEDEASPTGSPAAATTDASGAFQFAAEAVGRREVRLSIHSDWHFLPEAVPARASGGEEIVLVAERGGRIEGSVLGEDGRAVSGAKVVVVGSGGESTGFSIGLDPTFGGRVTREVETGDKGAFAIGGLPPGGPYLVSARGGGLTPVEAQTKRIVRGEVFRLELRAGAGGSIEGLVRMAEGPPVAGARVHARQEQSIVWPLFTQPPEYETTTGPDGRFRLANVKPGRVRLAAWTDTHVSAKPEGVPSRRAREKDEGIEVRSGKTAGPVEVLLRPGLVVGGTVVGPDGGPIADAEVSVSAWGLDDSPILGSRRGAGTRTRRSRTDTAGEFRFEGLPDDPIYNVVARKEPFARAATQARGTKTDIRLVLEPAGAIAGVVIDAERDEPVARFTVEAARGVRHFSVHGLPQATVQSAEEAGGGSPAPVVFEVTAPEGEGASQVPPGALAELAEATAGLGRVRREFDDATGKFLLPGLGAGKYSVSVRAEGYLRNEMPGVGVVRGETTRGLIFSLVRGSSIAGRVLGPDGGPAAGARLLARRSTEEQRSGFPFEALLFGAGEGTRSKTGEDGSFVLENLQPGTYDVVASAEASARGILERVEVGPAERREGVEIRLRAGGTLAGTVKDRKGRPLGGRGVMALSLGAAEGERTESGADGAYEIRGLEKGSYFVYLMKEGSVEVPFLGGGIQLQTASVRAGEKTQLDLIDEAAGGCRVFGVVRSGGEGFGEATVAAVRGENGLFPGLPASIETARADAEGRYAFEALAPGEYRFRFGTAGLGDLEDATEVEAEVPDSEEFRLDLTIPDAGVAGRIIESATGMALEGIHVRLLREKDVERPVWWGIESAPRRTSGADGSFRYEHVAPGSYALVAWDARRGKSGEREPVAFAPARVDLRVEAGRAVPEAVVRMEPGGALRLTFSSTAGGAAVEGLAEVESAEALLPGRDLEGISEGVFAVEGLAPGTYAVLVLPARHAATRVEGIEVARGARTERAVALERGIALSATLLDSRGERVQDARFEVLGAGGRQLTPAGAAAAFARLYGGTLQGGEEAGDPDLVGRFAPGTYRVRATRGGKEVASEAVELAGAEPRTVTLRER